MTIEKKEKTIKSHSEFDTCCNMIAEQFALVARAEAELELDLQAVRAKHEGTLQPLIAELDILVDAVESYATLYRCELLPKNKKSKETAQARWGWRSDPPSLALQRKVKWDLVLDRLRNKGKDDYIKQGKETPDKDKIKAEFSEEELMDYGLCLKSEEKFYIESKDGKESK